MKYETDTYSGTYFKTYANDRAIRIRNGWQVADENLIHKSTPSGDYVTGAVTYKKEE